MEKKEKEYDAACMKSVDFSVFTRHLVSHEMRVNQLATRVKSISKDMDSSGIYGYAEDPENPTQEELSNLHKRLVEYKEQWMSVVSDELDTDLTDDTADKPALLDEYSRNFDYTLTAIGFSRNLPIPEYMVSVNFPSAVFANMLLTVQQTPQEGEEPADEESDTANTDVSEEVAETSH